jgi:hypothetical protein
MFRQFATLVSPDALFDAHPFELAWLLEEVWRHRIDDKNKSPGDPDRRSILDATPPYTASNWPPLSPQLDPIFFLDGALSFRWDHLIYAYMIENTRVYEIFRRVVYEFAHGEKLGTPTAESQKWLRNTEELFYKDGAPFYIASVGSHVRPDLRANRRNPYQRMFGMELNHGGDDGKPYPYVRAEGANNEFVATFEEFLREVWVGMTFVTATASSNPTDPAKIAGLARKLKNMLMSRREAGNLAREEFSAVAAMAWFHLTLEYKNNNEHAPIVKALRAEANGTEQRLFKIAARVGLAAHGLSKHFFDIGDPISRLLIQIEFGDYDTREAAPALFTPAPGGNTPESALRDIIADWTAITGRDVKARKVTPS